MSHTPGPWQINTAGIGAHGGKVEVTEIYVYNPDIVDDVAIAADIIDPVTCKPSEANARLIAAAPDMFEALDNISGLSRALRAGGPDPMDLQGLSDALEEAVGIALSAIAKATGQ